MLKRRFLSSFGSRWNKTLFLLAFLLLSLVFLFAYYQPKNKVNFAVIRNQTTYQVKLTEKKIFGEILKPLSKNGTRLVLLKSSSLESACSDDSNICSLGLFEWDIDNFRLTAAVEQWNLLESKGRDYRLMRPTKADSKYLEITTHFFLVKDRSVIHIPIIFPRHKYFWIAAIEKLPLGFEYIRETMFSIPLPMAVEAFNCSKNMSTDLCVPENLDFYLWQLARAQFHECHYEDIVFKFKETYSMIELRNWTIQAELFSELYRLAKRLHIPFHLAGGTLLGWYRQCNQIAEHEDGDLEVSASDYNPQFFYDFFRSNIIRLCWRFGTPLLGLEYRACSRESYWTDIVLKYPTDEPGFVQDYIFWKGIVHSTTHIAEKSICSAELFDLLVFIPCNYAEIIHYAHGGKNNWFTPKKGYQYTTLAFFHEYKPPDNDIFWHQLKTLNCSDPDPMWVCDHPPLEVAKSPFYHKLVKVLEKNYSHYYKFPIRKT